MAIDGENSSVGTDSFLDVITNFVGILIILVMVVGQRARNAPLPAVDPPGKAELEAAQREAATIEEDVNKIAAQMSTVEAEVAARTYERDQVNTLVAAIEQAVAKRRAELDEKDQKKYDLARERALTADEMERLEKERRQADGTDAPQSIKIESYPTPLGKVVDGKEAHFQLRGGRLTYVPFEALIDRLKVEVRERAQHMDGAPEMADTLGPIGGFRMKYLVERFDTPRGSYLQVAQVELLPTSNQLGETMDDALAQNSRLRDKLSMMSPRQYTITVWTYPDSFSEFRRLKKELYELGYPVAGRPLPDGMPIGASPSGSKSSAQ